MPEAKRHIKKIVDDYIMMFREEHDIVKEMVAAKRGMTNGDFALLEGSKDTRALFEISETLSTMLVMQLNEEEIVWFKTKEGGRWFANAFPVYALPNKI